ncbi:integral membrane protein [Teratosphaeria destructans]|uniref:Integral membrane protein n=1 Tax=Teratosphaeria destructans TaxID=418781 RepID=A0A9W7SYK0_9PEZI|nr:integral membrane protein [Teratosphaeria destructans]
MERLRVLLISLTLASAQLLTNGNSQLPSCASSCQVLTQAASACGGGTTTASQSTWSCFCQSGYLKSLYDSDTGICDSVCTSVADSQQVSTWYKSNCGSDNGASEHAGSGSSSTATSASASVNAGSTASDPGATAAGASTATSNGSSDGGKSWYGFVTLAHEFEPRRTWSTHYRWVIMLIVLAIGLSSMAVLAVYIKRRYDRKADQIRQGFNAGITTRSAPPAPSRRGADGAGDSSFLSTTQMSGAGTFESGSGRNTPARTRDAFMPYGYGYTRSESRLTSRADMDARRSPLARGGTPVVDLEKEIDGAAAPDGGISTDSTQGKSGKRRILVRERSMLGPESPNLGENSVG